MKGLKLLLLLGSLVLVGCSWVVHPVDHNTRNYGHLSKAPDVFVRLGQASQICSGKDETALVDIFVTLTNLPAQEVKIVLDDQERFTFRLYGTEVHLEIKRAGIGFHKVDVYVKGYREAPVTLTWSVWSCPPKEHGDLYKPDGSGLKGYCPPECACTTQS